MLRNADAEDGHGITLTGRLREWVQQEKQVLVADLLAELDRIYLATLVKEAALRLDLPAHDGAHHR